MPPTVLKTPSPYLSKPLLFFLMLCQRLQVSSRATVLITPSPCMSKTAASIFLSLLRQSSLCLPEFIVGISKSREQSFHDCRMHDAEPKRRLCPPEIKVAVRAGRVWGVQDCGRQGSRPQAYKDVFTARLEPPIPALIAPQHYCCNCNRA